MLVLLPSRELAQQVHAQCTALFSVTGVSSAVVYGGVPKQQQVSGREAQSSSSGLSCFDTHTHAVEAVYAMCAEQE